MNDTGCIVKPHIKIILTCTEELNIRAKIGKPLGEKSLIDIELDNDLAEIMSKSQATKQKKQIRHHKNFRSLSLD